MRQDVPEYYTIEEVAEHFNVSHWTVRRWIKGGLPVIRIKRVIRIPADKLQAWEKAKAVK